ncbi:MAG: DegV family protein, partial [Clostridiales bacterium]|nr:DegV family protein [Candidatus Blautia equi]
MIRVLVDSAADYLKSELEERQIELVPLTITVNDETSYQDELELPREELFRMMVEEDKRIKTSQPSPQDMVEKFQSVKDAGDEMICIMLSSTLSGTYQSALLAKEIVDYDKIYIIDSLSATAGIQILANHAKDLIAQGEAAEAIVEKLEALKGRLKIVAVVDTLKYLYLGGRVSKATAVVADTVNIKPSIVVTREGAVGVGSKYLGVGRAVKDLAKQMKSTKIDRNFPLYLVYSYNDANVQKLGKALEEAGIHS